MNSDQKIKKKDSQNELVKLYKELEFHNQKYHLDQNVLQILNRSIKDCTKMRNVNYKDKKMQNRKNRIY